MKKLNFNLSVAVVLVVAITALAGCRKNRQIVEFDMPYSTDFVFSAATVTSGVNYVHTNVNTDIATYMTQNNMNGNLVGSATCTNFNLKLKGPAGKNLNVMSDYEFFMLAGYQKEVRVAHISPWINGTTPTQTLITSSNTNSMLSTLKIDGSNLKNYFLENIIDMKMKAYPTNTLVGSYTVTADYTVHVKGIEQ